MREQVGGGGGRRGEEVAPEGSCCAPPTAASPPAAAPLSASDLTSESSEFGNTREENKRWTATGRSRVIKGES